MLSPFREIELVHAVQQPVEAPEIKDILPNRNFDDTECKINVAFSVHGYSTHAVDFQADWQEIIDDPTAVEPETVIRRNAINDIMIGYHEKDVLKGSFPKEKPKSLQFNPVEESGFQLYRPPVDLQKMGKALQKSDGGKLNRLANAEELQRERVSVAQKSGVKVVQSQKLQVAKVNIGTLKITIPPLIQRFPDTKHRKVNYQISGTSRYREYFDKLIESQGLSVERDGNLVEKVIVPSSKRPAAPVVDYVVPAFEWRKTQTKLAMRHTRLGGRLRVYLKRPWFSSGEDEMLGVVLRPPITPSINRAKGSSSGYDPRFTLWGIDPTFPSKPTQIGPDISSFQLNPVTEQNLQYPGQSSTRANVAAYPVDFDHENKKWFADIALDTEQMYYPFIRLALARYQPYSVRKGNEDVCLSPIIQADFMQLPPHRIATITFDKEKDYTKFSINLRGVLPSARYTGKISNYFMINFYDLDIGQPRDTLLNDYSNERRLDREKVKIQIDENAMQNGMFNITQRFNLPNHYKDTAYDIVIREFEGLPQASGGSLGRVTAASNDQLKNENQPRLVYADRFSVAAKGLIGNEKR